MPRSLVTKLIPIVFLSLCFAACSSFRSGFSRGRQLAERNVEALQRCVDVPAEAVAKIQEGIHYVGGQASLREAKAVKSADHESIYFVSADIQGPDLEGAEEIATWAIDRLDEPGSVSSIDGLARQFSDWPSGDTLTPQLSVSADGVEDSVICASAGALTKDRGETEDNRPVSQ